MAQHGGKLLGYQTTQLQYLNLDNQFTAYDTYQRIILEICRKLKQDNVNSQVLALLTRKTLKQVIMTCEYGVSYPTAANRFTQLIERLHKTDERYALLRDKVIFKKIFTLLNKGLAASLFYNSTQSDWFETLSNNCKIFPDLIFDPIYYSPRYHFIYFEVGTATARKRAVIKTIVPCWETAIEKRLINNRKTQQAAYVNYVHAYDAAYLRALLRAAAAASIELAAIHDGFGVAYYNSK